MKLVLKNFQVHFFFHQFFHSFIPFFLSSAKRSLAASKFWRKNFLQEVDAHADEFCEKLYKQLDELLDVKGEEYSSFRRMLGCPLVVDKPTSPSPISGSMSPRPITTSLSSKASSSKGSITFSRSYVNISKFAHLLSQYVAPMHSFILSVKIVIFSFR